MWWLREWHLAYIYIEGYSIKPLLLATVQKQRLIIEANDISAIHAPKGEVQSPALTTNNNINKININKILQKDQQGRNTK